MPVPHQRRKVLDLIRAHANARGWVDIDIATIAEQTGIPAHDVTKSIWGLQKQALVSFRERKLGSGTNGRTQSALSRIRLTQLGRTIGEEAIDELSDPTDQQESLRSSFSIMAGYPLIGCLIARRARLEQAAAILSLADADELAVAALEQIERATPFEREVLGLLGELGLLEELAAG